MKKKNRTVLFIFVIETLLSTILFFFSTAGIYRFTEADASESPILFLLSQTVEENETSTLKIDQKLINSILNTKVKYIEFSDSQKYDHERNIVYRITNMAESERYSEGSIKKAFIRIALEDLNDDGMKEILAYIEQFEWCGKGGGYCTFLVLQKNGEGNWRELFRILTYRDIGILNTKNCGYSDIVFRNIIFRVSDREKIKDRQEITIWRWDGKRYEPYIKRKTIYDIKTNKERSMIWKWDEKSTLWSSIEENK